MKGSSKYKFAEGELITKNSCTNDKKSAIFAPTNEVSKVCDKTRTYTLNKSKVKKKIFAFYHLPDKQRYFRLWTLTFPSGTQDDICYKIFNNFLTRMRTEQRLQDYIWIAERQANGTIHFHMLFAQFINITEANNLAKIAINGAIKRGEIHSNTGIYEKYNGLDVSKKCGNFNSVAKYLTKYVTKNNTQSNRLPYYCSKSISHLFTTLALTAEEVSNMIDAELLSVSSLPIIEGDFFAFFAVNKIDIGKVFSSLFAVNSVIYQTFQQKKEEII